MKSLDTPVLFIIFRRPDTTQTVFNAIRKAKPKKLFVSADGPRKNVKKETKLCQQTRKIINKVDWDCKVYKKYNDKNLGCKITISSAINWFFKNVKAGIILEDDCLPNQSFFWFCQELLKKYADDERIMQIDGSNYLFGKKIGKASYYFSRLNDVWGWATWRRTWKHYDINMENFSDFKRKKIIFNYFDNKMIANWLMSYLEEAYKSVGTNRGIWSSAWSYAICLQKGLTIVPNVNLVSNIGIGGQATHAGPSFALYSHVKTQGIKKIIHPKFIQASKKADKLRFKIISRTDPRLRKGTKIKNALMGFLKRFFK